MKTQFCLHFVVVAMTVAAQTVPAPRLIEMSTKAAPAEFRQALLRSFDPKALKEGTAVAGEGPDFIWAVESEQEPKLLVDVEPRPAMKRLDGNLWYATGKVKTGAAHFFSYLVAGKPFGGRNDVPAFGPDSYSRGVPEGKLTDRRVHTSKIYGGMESNYWVYAPAAYDPSRPAALMVWQDGEGFVKRESGSHLLTVVDNLIAQKRIPVMIVVLISPGTIGERRIRSIEYDTVDDTYPRFLRDEILADVQKEYNIRRDAYSRAIAGQSSGGICSFNVAWQQNDQFSRVLSRIGSFTSIQWRPQEKLEGGNVYPFKIRKEPKHNIRVWLDDGSNDLENEHGSWPLQNIQMANSLKRQSYDFHFSFGNGTHSTAHGNAELPEALTWLWRDYDPSKTEQVYEMEAAEKDKPLFRVKIANR